MNARGGGQHDDSITFEDWHAIHALLVTYAELVDSGRFSEAAALFEHATYRVDHGGDESEPEIHRGPTEVEEYMCRHAAVSRWHAAHEAREHERAHRSGW